MAWVIRVDCGESIWMIVNSIVIEIAMLLEFVWGSYMVLYFLVGDLDRKFGLVIRLDVGCLCSWISSFIYG